MLIANTGIIPPHEWNHKFDLKNNNKQTVGMLIAKNGIYVPD